MHAKSINEAFQKMNKNEKPYCFVSDSPNVMKLTRRLLCGEQEDRSDCFLFAYGCCCHALSNFVKDICNIPVVKDTLSKTIKLAQLFINTHVANDFLKKERMSSTEPSQTIKSYSKTRWNGVAVLFRSVMDNKKHIGSVLHSQNMCDPSTRSLDFRSKSKANNIMSYATTGVYRAKVERLTPFLS